MIITYHGKECFKVAVGGTTVVFNPPSKDSKEKGVRFGADIVFVSLNHEDFNGTEQVAYGDRQPFVVDGPGQYEIGDVVAQGFGVPTTYEKGHYINTIYGITFENIRVAFLGAIGNTDIDASTIGALGDIDILFLPVGGGDVLDAAAASSLAVKLEARLIVPMHYDAASLKQFLQEEGGNGKPIDKLTIKKKDILPMEGEIVVLK